MRHSRRHIHLVLLVWMVAASCTGGDDTTETVTESTIPVATTAAATEPTDSMEPTIEQGEPPILEEASCEFDVPQGRDVTCGWVTVPADRSDPSAGTIRLHVAVFASESADPAPDPVVYLEGGPGADALEAVPLVFEDRFAHLLADRDVVFFDQRGTGFSEPSLACPELRELSLDLLDDDRPIDEIVPLQQQAITECHDRLVEEGADLDSFNSAASAADLADLRKALGYDEWNLYGISYGTRLALTTMRDHPEGIRSVVLDSAYPPEVDLIATAPANLDRALDELFTGCAEDPECAAAYPDLETVFYGLAERLDESPIRAPVTDVFTGTVYDAVFNGATFAGIVFQGLYSADAIPVLPEMIANVDGGETYELSILASSFLANGEFVSAGMQFSVQCNEEAPFSDPTDLDRAFAQYPELESVFEGSALLGSEFFATCAVWGAGEADPVENQPVTSSIPTLITAGEYDPITPPAWGEEVAAALDNATFVVFPGVGHGPTAERDCPKSVLRSFLEDPGGTVDTGCVATMQAPAFTVPGGATPEVSLVEFSESLFGPTLTGVRPEGWESVGPGVWARARDALDQTALVEQYAAGVPANTLLGLLGQQFGLGDDPQPVGTHDSAAGSWTIYLGEAMAAPVRVGELEQDAGTLIVVLVSPPSEADTLADQVFFPVLDAITIG